VGHDIAHAQAGHQNFREGADVNHAPVGVHGLQGGLGVAFVTQITHKLILQNGDIVLPGQGDQLAAADAAQARAGGVVKGGDGVDETRAIALEDFFQQINAHTIGVHRNADHANAQRAHQA